MEALKFPSHIILQRLQHRALLVGVFCIAVFTPIVVGFGSGAPKEACEDLTPQHGVDPQTTRSPYSIKLSKNKIRPGESVDITILGKKGETFKGFLVQARVGSTPVGAFSSRSKNVKLIDCGSGTKNSATHANPIVKKDVTITWTAPNNLKETVIFYYTVVKVGQEFWVKEKSNDLTVA